MVINGNLTFNGSGFANAQPWVAFHLTKDSSVTPMYVVTSWGTSTVTGNNINQDSESYIYITFPKHPSGRNFIPVVSPISENYICSATFQSDTATTTTVRVCCRQMPSLYIAFAVTNFLTVP